MPSLTDASSESIIAAKSSMGGCPAGAGVGGDSHHVAVTNRFERNPELSRRLCTLATALTVRPLAVRVPAQTEELPVRRQPHYVED